VSPDVTAFFDEATFTVTYLVADRVAGRCAIVDSVLDFDPKAGRTSTGSADQLIDEVRRRRLTVDWILETHVHADHLTAAPYLKKALGGRIGIGARVREVQATFGRIYNLPDLATDGSQFDRLFEDGEEFRVGRVAARVLHAPGHTPACVVYVIGDAAFTGDALFMPDFGTARCDFPGGDARQLYRSIRRVLDLPGETRLFTCHDYAPGGRSYLWESTVAQQRAENLHVRDGIDEDAFVAMREGRDKGLGMPTLLLPAVQVNIRAGHLPPPEDNGTTYLKLPLNVL
jgi:glyoxylase-like metal-dependent hydrolase (beta-lactamase superfamily II)